MDIEINDKEPVSENDSSDINRDIVDDPFEDDDPSLQDVSSVRKKRQSKTTGDNAVLTMSAKIKEIKIEQLVPFKNNPYKLRGGQDFQVFAQDVSENGVLEPIIVRMLDDEVYEILSGHNRFEAAKLAEFKTLTARVYKDLPDDAAALIVTRSNIHMRSKWSPLEQVQAVSLHYESIKRQGRRTDKLNKNENSNATVKHASVTSVENQQKSDARKRTASEFKITPNAVAQCLRINKLIDPLKKRFDDREINTYAADILTKLSEEQQRIVEDVLRSTKYKVGSNSAKALKGASIDGSFDRNVVEKILSDTDMSMPSSAAKIKLNSTNFIKYFAPDQKPHEIENEIIKALEYYREHINH